MWKISMSSVSLLMRALPILLLLVIIIGIITMQTDENPEDELTEHERKDLEMNRGKNLKTIKFTKPTLTEEDEHGLHMPAALKCDACRIISYKLTDKFERAQAKFKNPTKRLSESDVIDIVESVCEDKFDSYGVKEVDGVKRLSGPGLETADVPGLMQGGGPWPIRLQTMCREYVGEVDEEAMYAVFLHKSSLEEILCQGGAMLGACSKVNTASTTKKNKRDDF